MDYDQQIEAAQLRQRNAMGRTQFQNPEGRMVSGIYVAPNPLEYLSAALRSAGAGRESLMAGQEAQNLSAQKREATANALRQFNELSQGRPADAPGADGMGPVRPAQAPNMGAAYSALMQSPELRQAGMQGITQMPQLAAQQQAREDDRLAKAQESQANRALRIEELMLKMQNENLSQEKMINAQKELRQMQIQAQKDMQRMISSNRPDRQAQIIQTDTGPMQLINGQAVPILGPGGKPVAGKPAAGAGNTTEGERKAATLLQRIQNSEAQLDAALAGDKGAEKPGLISTALRGAGMETLANTVTPGARQRVESAQLDILDAALTLGTGAAYTKEQLEGYRKSYFPQIGDTKENIQDKQARLNNILSAARIAAGRAAGEVPLPRVGNLTSQDQQALQWANANPNDPRAAAIRQKLGAP